jgi:hypothetical protein
LIAFYRGGKDVSSAFRSCKSSVGCKARKIAQARFGRAYSKLFAAQSRKSSAKKSELIVPQGYPSRLK